MRHLQQGPLTWISDGYSQKLAEDVADDINRVRAGLMADGVVDHELGGSQDCLFPHIGIVVLEIG